jgi:chromate transporter
VGEDSVGPLRLVVPDPASLDVASLALAAMSMLAMLRFRVGMLATLAAAATTGLAWRLLLGG